jgi:hypothetical protein
VKVRLSRWPLFAEESLFEDLSDLYRECCASIERQSGEMQRGGSAGS